MPVNDRRTLLSPSAGTTLLQTDFQVLDELDLLVKRTRAGITAALAIDTDYTLSGIGLEAGCFVTLLTPTLADDSFVLDGNTQAERVSDYDPNQTPSGDQIDGDLNRITHILQEQRRDIDGIPQIDVEDLVLQAGTAANAAQTALATLLAFGVPLFVSGFAALATVTPVQLAVGKLVCTPTAIYQRVASGGHLNYSGSGGVRLNVIPKSGRYDVQDFGAKGDGGTLDDAAFELALTAVAGSTVWVPYTVAGYLLSSPIFVGRGRAGTDVRASWLRGDGYVTLKFSGLTNSQDAVTLTWDEHGGVTGLTIDMGNAYTSNATYTGRDGLRVYGGNWPTIDVRVLNAGREGVHFEASANTEWLENLNAPHIEVINCGRDAIQFVNANLTACFMNEMVFHQVEARHWKRNAIRVINDHTQFGLTGVKWLHANFDARRALVDLISQDIVYFEDGSLAGLGSNCWEFLGGAWENVNVAHPTGYGINADVGALFSNGLVVKNVFTYQIGTSFNAQDQLINKARLTGSSYWIETLNGGGETAIGGRVLLPGNPCALATATATDATGDGTAYSLNGAVWVETLDRGSWFAGGTFTAPCAGIYQFDASLLLAGLTSSHTFAVLYFDINSGAQFHNVDMKNPWANANASAQCTIQGMLTISLARGDTVKVGVQVSGGTKVVDIIAGSRVSGRLAG